MICTEMWHEVINLISQVLRWMLILSASGRGTYWVRLLFDISISLNEFKATFSISRSTNYVTLSFFRGSNIVFRSSNIWIFTKIWYKVVTFRRICWICWPIVMVVLFFSNSSTILGSHNVTIFSKIWHEVVNLVSSIFRLMFILCAAT